MNYIIEKVKLTLLKKSPHLCQFVKLSPFFPKKKMEKRERNMFLETNPLINFTLLITSVNWLTVVVVINAKQMRMLFCWCNVSMSDLCPGVGM